MATTTAPAVLPDKRERWLAARRELITASDAAAILGVDDRRSAMKVYAEKLGAIEDEDSIPKAWGRRLEDDIAEGYAEATGRKVELLDPYELVRHPDLKWLAATPDRRVAASEWTPAPPGLSAGPVTLEIKAVSEWRLHDWREEVPTPYQVQGQIQIACEGATWGSITAFLGITRAPAWVDLLRNDAFLEVALPKLHEFWLRVRRREPPAIEDVAVDSTVEAIRKLWSKEDGKTIPLNDPEVLELVAEWEKAKETKNDTDRTVKILGSKLKVLMGDASYGALADGSFLTLKVTEREAYDVESGKYRTLRRWWPKLLKRR